MEGPEDALREAQSAESSGELVLASTILRSAVKRWKREPEFKMRYGRVLRKLGQDRRALKMYRAVLKSHPQRADAAQAAAESAQSLGKVKMAEMLWARALSVGAQVDIATVGLCRAKWTRGLKEEAWEMALQCFVQNGRNSRHLHDFLIECSPILGTSVPDFDQFDVATLEAENSSSVQIRNESTIDTASFGSDTVESMAGMSVEELTSADKTLPGDLLDENTQELQHIDMSALSQQSQARTNRPEVELPDDLLDFE